MHPRIIQIKKGKSLRNYDRKKILDLIRKDKSDHRSYFDLLPDEILSLILEFVIIALPKPEKCVYEFTYGSSRIDYKIRKFMIEKYRGCLPDWFLRNCYGYNHMRLFSAYYRFAKIGKMILIKLNRDNIQIKLS